MNGEGLWKTAFGLTTTAAFMLSGEKVKNPILSSQNTRRQGRGTLKFSFLFGGRAVFPLEIEVSVYAEKAADRVIKRAVLGRRLVLLHIPRIREVQHVQDA